MEEWIANERAKGERRSKIVPSSTEQITDDRVDAGLAAMDAIARWLADHPEVPLVELAAISREEITLGMQEAVRLPEPFVPIPDSDADSSETWKVSVADALELPGGEDYGFQTAALTALGNKADGSRILLNVCRWQILGLAGTPEWVEAALISQIMVQATESWSRDQHLWLIGLGQTAEKLISFLCRYHPEHHFHAAPSLSAVPPESLEGVSATLYVADADQSTYLQFKALQTPHVGMLTAGVVSNEAMFMSEASGGAAVVAPLNVSIFPNLAPDLIEAMDVAWAEREKLEDQAAAEAAAIDYDELLGTDEADDAQDEGRDAAGIDAAFTEIMASAGLSAEPAGPDDSPEAAEPAGPSEPVIHLMGPARVTGPDGDLTGRHAQAVALLHISSGPVPAHQVSEALWPGDDAEGHTARTRRSRLLTKIRSAVPSIDSTDEGWLAGPLTADCDQIAHTLRTAPLDETADLIAACERVGPALSDAGPWAEEQRGAIAQRMRTALDQLIDRALDGDALAVVKAARAAVKRTGE